MPAGHIEPGEDPDAAAQRELQEESGAITFTLEYLLDYSVEHRNTLLYGRLYLADITKIGGIPDREIAEICLRDELPADLTYPEVQKVLFAEVTAHYFP
jgi:8-oxo-dGTP diphosphatase